VFWLLTFFTCLIVGWFRENGQRRPQHRTSKLSSPPSPFNRFGCVSHHFLFRSRFSNLEAWSCSGARFCSRRLWFSHRLTTPATAVSSSRDYAVGDMAQKRFEKVEGQKKLGLNFHVRGDGTRAYYFSKGASGHCARPSVFAPAALPYVFVPVWACKKTLEFTAELWGEMGFTLDENDYCQRVVTNRKQQVDLNRLFLQGKYRKQ